MAPCATAPARPRGRLPAGCCLAALAAGLAAAPGSGRAGAGELPGLRGPGLGPGPADDAAGAVRWPLGQLSAGPLPGGQPGGPPGGPQAPGPGPAGVDPSAHAASEMELAAPMPKEWERMDGLAGSKLAPPFSSQADLDRLMKEFKYVWTPKYRDLPPVPLDGGPLAVGVRLELVKFQALNEVAGTADLVVDLMLCWSDDRLSFNSDQVFHRSWSHMGDKLPIAPGMIWTPDIAVSNQVAHMENMFETADYPMVLADNSFKEQTGVNVLWTRRMNLKTRCSVDMTHFPFDRQSCSILIGSWASSRRQLLLVPQDEFRTIAAGGSHTSEFHVVNFTVRRQDVYMRNAAEKFEEVRYAFVLERYPHFYIVNFILPMVAVTMLTIATMWMTHAGTRMNSGTRLVLCIVQIMNITASWRPANDRDIWLDRFQSHCLALSMSAVLQSLVMDYLPKTGLLELPWAPRAHLLDTVTRTVICLTAIVSFLGDLCELVQARSVGGLYGSFHGHSSKLLVGFVYMIFACLGSSSVLSILWRVLPRESWRGTCIKMGSPGASPRGSSPSDEARGGSENT